MTEGLKVAVKGAKLRVLCLKRGEHHRAYFHKDRDTIEKRSGSWLKELARQSQATVFDLNRWISEWSLGFLDRNQGEVSD